ncbi:hypothetical protein Tco_1229099 [Tanacetum coccineum]
MNNNRNRNNQHLPDKRHETTKVYAGWLLRLGPTDRKRIYRCPHPYCDKCNWHHVVHVQDCARVARSHGTTGLSKGWELAQNNRGYYEVEAYPRWWKNAAQLPRRECSNWVREFLARDYTPFIDINPVALGSSYEVELADGKIKRIQFLGHVVNRKVSTWTQSKIEALKTGKSPDNRQHEIRSFLEPGRILETQERTAKESQVLQPKGARFNAQFEE